MVEVRNTGSTMVCGVVLVRQGVVVGEVDVVLMPRILLVAVSYTRASCE